MALSLVCKDCHLPLRSVAEVQEHGETTGHSNFEESTEAVLSLAVQWIMEHEEDPEAESPLLVAKDQQQAATPKRQLTPEEAKKEAEELIRKAKAKREREERESERLREQERIRSGKELAQAKRLEDDLQLKRNMEARRIEKAEAARAKERIRAKLEEDRKERRRKLGLPEEPTEAEKQAAAEKAKPQPAPEQRSVNAPPPPRATIAEQLRKHLVNMKKAHAGEDERIKTCWATLMKYCGNIAQNPAEEKFRRIRLSNAAFQTRVGSVTGGIDFLKTLGFDLVSEADGSQALFLPQDKATRDVLNVAGAELNSAMTNPYFGML
ncbi:hypothetical protein WJX73_008748 [Symbiochloris irregularis]|uniref:PUB domain-containing protein n=1 Tax=Symbiochloris irregularis TaxID=706552 RepID=A0AAW1NU73_9CHLO